MFSKMNGPVARNLAKISIGTFSKSNFEIPGFQSFGAHILPRTRKMSTWADPKELQIPVSYGHIAARAWGKETDPPVLALHGWQDNAGTFDRLIPLLTPNLYIIAMDMPGHGLSSHKPQGSFYQFMELLLDVKRVVDYFNWNTFSIMGHSLGAALGFMYASVFPEAVLNLVSFDIAKPSSRKTTALDAVARKGIINLLAMEKKMSNPSPVYTLEEARERLIEGLFKEVNKDSADILLKRGIKPADNGKGVVFSRDIRVRMPEDLYMFSHDNIKFFMSKITCNLLIIFGKASFIAKFQAPELNEAFLNLYKENCKSFEAVSLEGNHFVHLNNPNEVAPYVNNFFELHL